MSDDKVTDPKSASSSVSLGVWLKRKNVDIKAFFPHFDQSFQLLHSWKKNFFFFELNFDLSIGLRLKKA
jgi:hypothetical protein